MSRAETKEYRYAESKACADELATVASDLSKLSEDTYQDIFQQISEHWYGENANAYLRKGARIQEAITSSADALERIADEICEAAKREYPE